MGKARSVQAAVVVMVSSIAVHLRIFSKRKKILFSNLLSQSLTPVKRWVHHWTGHTLETSHAVLKLPLLFSKACHILYSNNSSVCSHTPSDKQSINSSRPFQKIRSWSIFTSALVSSYYIPYGIKLTILPCLGSASFPFISSRQLKNTTQWSTRAHMKPSAIRVLTPTYFESIIISLSLS